MVEKSKDIIKEANMSWRTTKEVAEVLGLSPISLRRFKNEHKDLLQGLTTRSIIERNGKRREHLLWDDEAIKILAMNISNPQTDQWKKDVIDEVSEKGYIITEDASSYGLTDWALKQLEVMRAIALAQKKQEQKLQLLETQVSQVDSGLHQFEQRYEDEKGITPQTKKDIKDFINDCTTLTGKHWGRFWPKIWRRFGISTTVGISEKLGQEILRWLKENRREFLGIQYKKLS
ncbi:MAG: hypothetical protein ACTSUT_08080 [Promethearchaeota archaeon]